MYQIRIHRIVTHLAYSLYLLPVMSALLQLGDYTIGAKPDLEFETHQLLVLYSAPQGLCYLVFC